MQAFLYVEILCSNSGKRMRLNENLLCPIAVAKTVHWRYTTQKNGTMSGFDRDA